MSQGTVARAVSESTLESWADVLSKWDGSKKKVALLVRKGVPEAFRAQVGWVLYSIV